MAIDDVGTYETDSFGDPGGPTMLVYFTLGLKEWAGAIPAETWLAQFEVPESGLHDLRERVESILARPSPGYSYREVRGRTSWGADSGEIVRAILFVSSSGASGVIGNAMYDLLKSFAETSTCIDPRPMEEGEAVERAKWVLVSHFGHDVESLEPVPFREEDLDLIGTIQDRVTLNWTVTFQDARGSQYFVELGLDDLPVINKVGWKGPARN